VLQSLEEQSEESGGYSRTHETYIEESSTVSSRTYLHYVECTIDNLSKDDKMQILNKLLLELKALEGNPELPTEKERQETKKKEDAQKVEVKREVLEEGPIANVSNELDNDNTAEFYQQKYKHYKHLYVDEHKVCNRLKHELKLIYKRFKD
jgi:hypothetical protein